MSESGTWWNICTVGEYMRSVSANLSMLCWNGDRSADVRFSIKSYCCCSVLSAYRKLRQSDSTTHNVNALLSRHRASTSMYSLTFRVRVATPAQYGRTATASLQITSHMHQARRLYRWCVRACVRSACGVRWAWRITAGLCHAFP